MIKSQWTPARDGKLRDLWMAETATATIALMLDTTKNSVIGRAHRLGLPSRKNPIVGRVSKPRVEREPHIQQGPLKRAEIVTPPPVEEPLFEPAPAPIEEAAPMPDPVAAPERPPLFMLPIGRCQWIAGEPTADDYCKCGRHVIPGLPYCGDHQAKAYGRRIEAPSAA